MAISFSSLNNTASSSNILPVLHFQFHGIRAHAHFLDSNNAIHSNSFENYTIPNNSVPNSSYTNVLNPSDNLCLHPLDNPNYMLVNDLLNGKNYGTWKKSMEIA